MDLQKLADAYACIREQSANQPLEKYISLEAVDLAKKHELLNQNIEHIEIASKNANRLPESLLVWLATEVEPDYGK